MLRDPDNDPPVVTLKSEPRIIFRSNSEVGGILNCVGGPAFMCVIVPVPSKSIEKRSPLPPTPNENDAAKTGCVRIQTIKAVAAKTKKADLEGFMSLVSLSNRLFPCFYQAPGK